MLLYTIYRNYKLPKKFSRQRQIYKYFFNIHKQYNVYDIQTYACDNKFFILPKSLRYIDKMQFKNCKCSIR